MSAFLTPLKIDRIHGTRKRRLDKPLRFRDAQGKRHTVPKGFVYNGPSFPIIWGGDGESASALHDYAYSRPDIYTREEADALLLDALEAEGMNAARRRLWWLGVRAFGGFFHRGPPEQPHDDINGA